MVQSCLDFLDCFCVLDLLVMMHPPSLCRIMRRCRRIAWLSWLHCLHVDPTKERAQTLLTSTLAPWRCCHSAGLILFLRNYWPTSRKGEGQTCALSAPTCSDSQGQELPTMRQGRRPLCDQEHRLWNYVHLNLMGWNIQYVPQCANKIWISRIKDF